MIDKPIYVVNNPFSCVDLIFFTSPNVILKNGVDVSIIDK